MTVLETSLPGVLVIEPRLFSDERGFFFESFNVKDFSEVANVDYDFVQDNHSKSSRGVLRGLHYQIQRPQGKLVRVTEGAVLDVAIDIREGSPNFGDWVGIELSESNMRQLWIPPDFAHGFLVLSEAAQVLYKATDYYAPEYERTLKWDDPSIGIDWPELDIPPLLSQKDQEACFLSEADLPRL
ncbi:dTDP-4-dehydrorhamnose 3,5-epimerase [Luminiphilus sp.]|nr:dTDP-4-dehydrorhamnose 3,5-epimerase [Luminiphilus sp.]